PAYGQGRRRLRMMKDPEVYIDPTVVALPTEARIAWRELLMRCLANDPTRRPRRGAELADQLDALIRRWDIPGRVAVACGPGQLELSVGSAQPFWVLHDRR